MYIGVTQKPLSQRFDGGKGYVKCSRFYDDILKYGFDNFEHIVIQSGMNRDDAMRLEEVLIDAFDAMNPERGYNMRRGGYHNVPCAEVGRKISEAKMGHEVTEETRAKLREYGKRPVLQMSIDGIPLRIYPSLTDAADAVNAKKSNIYAVCTGKKPTCRNYKWSYYQEVIK